MKNFSANLLLVLVAAFAGWPMRAQAGVPAKADSLRQALRASRADTNRVALLLQLGFEELMKPGEDPNDMARARAYADQALTLSRSLDYYSGQGQSLNLIGHTYKEEKKYPKAIAVHQAAIKLYQLRNDTKMVVYTSRQLFMVRRDQGDRPQALRDAEATVALAKRYGHWNEAGEAYVEWGHIFDIWKDQLPQRIAVFQQALQCFEKASNKNRQANLLTDLGELEMLQGTRLEALKYLSQALSIYQSIGRKDIQGLYDLLGLVSSGVGNYEAGVKYGLLALKTAQSVQDTSLQLCTIYNRLGMSYGYLKERDKAYQSYKTALQIALKWKDQSSILITSCNLSNHLTLRGMPAEAIEVLDNHVRNYPATNTGDSVVVLSCYLRATDILGRYAAARGYYSQLMKMKTRIETSNNTSSLRTLFSAIIEHSIKNKHYPEAEYILKQAIPFNKKNRLVSRLAENYLWRAQVDSAQGRLLSALKFYQQYKLLQDSLLNQVKSNQIASLEVQYDTEQKEQNLLLKQQRIDLLTKQAALQQQQLEKDRLIRNVIFAGIGLLLLLLFALVNRYRLKQRSNRQLQAQQREINEKNRHLYELLNKQEQLLTEKQWLLKEVHHRVKNNLQVIMSLLNSQANYLGAGAALDAIQESQHRVQAMALIHQRLYQSDLGARIAMPAYINDVASYLRDSFDLPQLIEFELDIDPIELDAALAVPLGLIINEALTNALKYAFPGGRPGRIALRLYRLGEASYQLEIEDDGVGLPADFNPGRSRSLGMTLIQGLSQQLGGELRWHNDNGLKLSLAFREEQLNSAPASTLQPA